MRGVALAALSAALVLAACAKSGSGLPSDALDLQIGRAIGDPTTCVLIADRSSHKVLYSYGQKTKPPSDFELERPDASAELE